MKCAESAMESLRRLSDMAEDAPGKDAEVRNLRAFIEERGGEAVGVEDLSSAVDDIIGCSSEEAGEIAFELRKRFTLIRTEPTP